MRILLVGVLLSAQTLVAAETTETNSDHQARKEAVLEEVLVVGARDIRSIDLIQTLDIAPDTAQLLKKAAGANVLTNGALTGIAQYRGMSRMRISTRIDGATISPGGPNWMDPPLSYAPSATVETLEVFRGIAPVSAGQETIGGVVNATNWRGDFSDEGPRVEGRLRTGARSANDATLLSGGVAVANAQQRLNLSGFTEQASDADFADGRIVASEYKRDRFDVAYGFRTSSHTMDVSFGRNNTGDAGTPVLPMDIEYIDADLYGLSHVYQGEQVQLHSNVYYNDIDHGMTNYHLRTAPATPANFRRNIADSRNLGFSSIANLGPWRIGADVHSTEHDSNVDNPNNPAFFVANFNNAERDTYGIFLEHTMNMNEHWVADFGIRYNHIEMNAQEVDATPAQMGMPPAQALRDTFNAADRDLSDDNLDWVVKLNYLVDESLSYYGGFARKTRSPSYQERYLWLPLQATAGLADGQTYTGNLNLDPEVAHEVELGMDWQRGAVSLSPRAFYRYVNDYIQGTESSNQAAVAFVRMMNMMNGTSNPDPLEFNNVDATFYGVDLDWRVEINDRWSVHGVVNYVRAQRDDTSDDIYRVPPLNAFAALDYRQSGWGLSLESLAYDKQNNVSQINREQESDSYALFNLRGFWFATDAIRLALGVENLTDKNYADHLSGINRVRGNPDIAVGERLPGYGRNFFARLDVNF